TFKGFENSECPYADCPKNCNHSPPIGRTPSTAEPSIKEQKDTTRSHPSTSSSSGVSSGTTAVDGASDTFPSWESSRDQFINTASTSRPPEKQGKDDKEEYRTCSYQPSLAAGGTVDLTKTFVPTAHGTFSFGGTPKKKTPTEPTPAPATEVAGTVTEGVQATPPPPTDAAAPIRDANEDEAETQKAITPAGPVPDHLGAAPEGASQTLHMNGQADDGAQGVTNGSVNGRRGSADPLYARRRAGTGSSNPMVESSASGAPIVPIPPELLYRSESATGVNLMNTSHAPLPTSVSSYRRRLSKESREELKKQQPLVREAKRDH
ncbi:hypothetical protein N431DRAFT_345907, partial [Stipitochalara longipes BDJ]